MDELDDLNFVRARAIITCVDDDSPGRESQEHAPSNDPGEKLKFPKSLSVN